MKAQVVGVPDDVANEIPVAVVRMPTKAQIMKAASDMGQKYSLGGVYTLEDLDLKSFPVTRTGKVLKNQLRAVVVRARERERASSQGRPRGVPSDEPTAVLTLPQSRQGPDSRASTKDASYPVSELSAIVQGLTGSSPSPEADLRTLMDSVTLLRYSDMILRKLGRRLYLSDVLKHPTLAEHAALLQSRTSNQHGALRTPATKQLNGPTSTGPGTLLPNEGIENYATMDSDIHTAASRILKQLHIDMSEIEEVYPVKANHQRLVSGQRPQTYRHRMIFRIGEATAFQTRQAVEAALNNRPVLRTILVGINHKSCWHVVIRNTAISSHIIQQVEVPDDQGLDALEQDDSAEAFHPQLSMQAKIVTVHDSGKVHLLLTYSHTVFDFLSIGSFHEDLGQLLSGAEPSTMNVVPRTPFKFFSDLYHNYIDSAPARASVQAISHRLRGISKMQAALWPRQRAPGWMIGTDAAAEHELALRRRAVRERVWAESGRPWDDTTARDFRYPRLARVVNLPDMKRLQAEKGLHPQTVAVAALAAFNCLRTGQPYALFNTIDAGRSWPFVPAWMEPMLPSPASVDGPTMAWVLNMIRVADLHRAGGRGPGSRGGGDQAGPETVGEFLERVQREQDHTAAHAHAPWDRVLEALGPDEGRVAVDAASRQTFNWDASLRWVHSSQQPGGSSLKLEARYDWPDW